MSCFGAPATLLDLSGEAIAPDDDVAARLALLAAVADGARDPVVRVTRPRPTAAFSRRDALLPGHPRAAAAAAAAGYVPVLRPVGGRMAAYHRGCLVLDVVGRTADPRAGSGERFERTAAVLVRALRGLGVDARTGPVPREYCPGEHSVNVGGTTKVAGTAQRQVRGGYLLSLLLVVQDPLPLREVVARSYDLLGLDVAPGSVGAVAETRPAVTVEAVRDAVLAELADELGLRTEPVPVGAR